MDELGPEDKPELPASTKSAYLHTPYCSGVCNFCSYFLTTVSAQDKSPIESYLDTVKLEIMQRSQETDLDLSYLYFGGGTPSLIPSHALSSFFEFLEKNKFLNPNRFGTFELHPEFFQDYNQAQEFIMILKANGIGRVSLGFQSSDEAVLENTNRRHGTGFLQDAIDFLKHNEMLVNLDLIYGLPDMTLEQWEYTLDTATGCSPDSISTYFLFVNKGTAMHAHVRQGRVILPSHQEIQIQHIMAQTVLEEKGFLELPNDFYAKVDGDPGAFTQDHLPSDASSLPLGAGSYGYYDNTQFFNQFSLPKYRQRVEAGESPIWRGHRFKGGEEIHRDVMFSLKNSPYVDRNLFERKYGIDPANFFADILDRLAGLDLLVVDDAAKRITLTPKGRLCVEEIACQFEIPNLRINIATGASKAERRKLDKHNFAPLYGIVERPT